MTSLWTQWKVNKFQFRIFYLLNLSWNKKGTDFSMKLFVSELSFFWTFESISEYTKHSCSRTHCNTFVKLFGLKLRVCTYWLHDELQKVGHCPKTDRQYFLCIPNYFGCLDFHPNIVQISTKFKNKSAEETEIMLTFIHQCCVTVTSGSSSIVRSQWTAAENEITMR